MLRGTLRTLGEDPQWEEKEAIIQEAEVILEGPQRMDPEPPYSDRQRAQPRRPIWEERQWVDPDHLLHTHRHQDQMEKEMGVEDHQEDIHVEEAEGAHRPRHPHRLLAETWDQRMKKNRHPR